MPDRRYQIYGVTGRTTEDEPISFLLIALDEKHAKERIKKVYKSMVGRRKLETTPRDWFEAASLLSEDEEFPYNPGLDDPVREKLDKMLSGQVYMLREVE